ncbi:MAG: alkyl sulfatase dimerization domain-containing protein, partial [Chloroflexota bacterium]
FGVGLRGTERISLGIGSGERNLKGLGNGGLPPTYLVKDEELEVEIDGVALELVAAPGESDDTLLVWLPEKKVLICGDTFYHTFPSLYSLWGERRRDIRRWIESLEIMIDFEAEVLIPGHTRPVSGKDEIKTILTHYHAALSHIHTEIVSGINKGLGPDELVETLELPAQLADLPYLQEFYGSLAWGIRAIYSDYLGWFDGNPTNLSPLSRLDAGIRIANMVGGEDMLLAQLKRLVHQRDPKDWQWGLQLADYLMALGSFEDEATDIKADLLLLLADEEQNAIARNWYIYSARELRREI